MFGCCCGGGRISWWKASFLAIVWSALAGLLVAGRVWYSGGNAHEMAAEGLSLFSLVIAPVWSALAVSGRGRRCGRGDSASD